MNIQTEVARIMDELALAEHEYEQEMKPKRDREFTERRRKMEERRYCREHGIDLNEVEL